MQRYIPLAVIALLMLGFVFGRGGTVTTAGEAGGTDTFLPLVELQPTPTPANVGTGVFKEQLVSYHDYSGTFAYGFVRFFDGTPAFGGMNNYHVWVDFACESTYRSTDLDGSGYYSIPINGFPAQPIKCPGRAWLMIGPFGSETRVSNDVAFDTSQGSCWRIDFIECRADDTSPACTLTNAQGHDFAATASELSPSPQNACPP